jgi:hypothetical protein
MIAERGEAAKRGVWSGWVVGCGRDSEPDETRGEAKARSAYLGIAVWDARRRKINFRIATFEKPSPNPSTVAAWPLRWPCFGVFQRSQLRFWECKALRIWRNTKFMAGPSLVTECNQGIAGRGEKLDGFIRACLCAMGAFAVPFPFRTVIGIGTG